MTGAPAGNGFEAPVPPADRPQDASSRRRSTARWVLGALLALDFLLLCAALSLSQVTAAGPAKRALAHSVAVLSEIDAFLDDRYEALRQEAAETEEATVEVDDFPVPLSLAPAEIERADRETVRVLMLRRAADRIYEQGASVMADDGAAEAGFFSPQGLLSRLLDFLRERPHNVLTRLVSGFAATAGVLALGLMLASRGYRGLAGVGLCVSLAALPFLIAVVALRFALRIAGDGADDALAREFLWLAQELTWAPIRTGLVFSVGGGLFVALGSALARWSDWRGARA